MKSWHSLDVEKVFKELGTSEEGLTRQEVSKRLKRYGPNRLPEPKKRSALIRFLLQFHDILIYV
ncbi:MAG: hypothetical protein L3J42_07575, partial [Hydrogenimonas sp.]|nr:hypothetical protein [Hydrogenimonas sp.]